MSVMGGNFAFSLQGEGPVHSTAQNCKYVQSMVMAGSL